MEFWTNFLCACVFLGLHPGHMEVPRIEIESGALAAGLYYSHSNAGSDLHLQTTPHLKATPDS